MVKHLPAIQEIWVHSLGGEEGNGHSLQYSRLQSSKSPWGHKEQPSLHFQPLPTSPASPDMTIVSTLCNPVDRSLPGSSVHGIFQQE